MGLTRSESSPFLVETLRRRPDHITRLTDPAAIGKRENITVQRLTDFRDDPELRGRFPDVCDDLKLCARVESFAAYAVENAKSARDWRNKHISHSDLNQAIDLDAKPLDPPTLDSVQGVLDAVHAALDAISSAFMGAHISNFVHTREPVAMAFLSYAQMLVAAVRYVDSLIEPAGSAPSEDTDVEANFLAKVVGREPTMDEILQIIYLRKAARRFS